MTELLSPFNASNIRWCKIADQHVSLHHHENLKPHT